MAATYTWKAGAGTTVGWSNSSSWSPAAVPGSSSNTSDTDVVLMPSNGVTFTITFDETLPWYIGAFTMGTSGRGGNPTLDIGGNTLIATTAGGATGKITTLNTSGADTIKIGGGAVTAQGGFSLSQAGTISGKGTVTGAISASSTIAGAAVIASGGTLEIATGTTGTLVGFSVSDNSVLRLDASVGSNTITMAGTSTSGSILQINASAATFGSTTTIAALGASSTKNSTTTAGGVVGEIDFVNAGTIIAANSSISADGKTLTVATQNKGNYTLLSSTAFTNDFLNFTTDGSGGSFVWVDTVSCFALGTAISTVNGGTQVEALTEGDQIITVESGTPVAVAVQWIGYRTIDLSRHPRPETAAPITFHRGALGDNVPLRDLTVSPDHSMFIDGKLIPAKLLVNGMTIVQNLAAKSVTYYHVETERHAVLLAEGAPAETYLDTGNRAFFDNAGMATVLHPEFTVNASLRCWESDACAPLAVSPDIVGPISQRLAERAAMLGYHPPEVELTNDPDLHLVADGQVIRPVTSRDGRHVFILPPAMSSLRLGSRANRPSALSPYYGDSRQLGVAVSRIMIRSGDSLHDVALDHPALADGWHRVERDRGRMWRWTNGDAALPISGKTDRLTLELQIQPLQAYRPADALPSHRSAA